MAGDHEKTMEECDYILSKAVADAYTLDILADWKSKNNPKGALADLLKTAEDHKKLSYLHAACLIRAGELYQRVGRNDYSKQCLEGVLEDSATPAKYKVLAQDKLKLVAAAKN